VPKSIKGGIRRFSCQFPFFLYAGFVKRTVTFFYSISTDVSKIYQENNTGLHKNGGYILFFKVLHYLRVFSYSPYLSLACMCVTVPADNDKY
jgi:hypothetical protein